MKKILYAALGAVLAILPVSGGAVTVTVKDIGTGDSARVWDAGLASFSGSVGGFDVSASGKITRSASQYALDALAIQTSGIGTLLVTVKQGGLAGFGNLAADFGVLATLSDATRRVSVKHFINAGSGLTQIGDPLKFYGTGGDGQTGSTTDAIVTTDGRFKLITQILIVSRSADQSTNVSSSLVIDAPVAPRVSPVPVPAAGLLLLGALGGLGFAARRRKNG